MPFDCQLTHALDDFSILENTPSQPHGGQLENPLRLQQSHSGFSIRNAKVF